MLNKLDESNPLLKELNDAIEKKYQNGGLKAGDYDRIKKALSIISEGNSNSDVIRMREFSETLAKSYPEFEDTVHFFTGENVTIKFKNGTYIVEGKYGKFTGRSKKADSVFSKIRKKVIALKKDVPENLAQADIMIGDAGGFRYTINGVNKNTAESIISGIVPASERKEFDEFFTQSYKLSPAEKAKVNPKFLEYEKQIIEHSINVQSDKFVAKLCEGIDTGKIRIQELHNYCGANGIPYFSEEHLQKITVSYQKWFDRASKDTANYTIIRDKDSGLVTSVKDKYGNKFERALPIENSSTNIEKIKESGYTSSQFNIIGENGLRIEFQYRSSRINDFAEYEHIPYDIRENKDTVSGSEYNAIRNILKDETKMSNKEYTEFYNPYLTQVYNYNRRIELGLPVGEKPVLNKNNFQNLTQEEINMISVDGLERLHTEIKNNKKK